MAVYSMTGFASGRAGPGSTDAEGNAWRNAQGALAVELRSVNSRFLDLTLRLPDEWRQHEGALRQLIGQHVRRGKVELRAFAESTADGELADPPPRLLQRLSNLQDQVRTWLPDAPALSVAEALRLAAGPSRTAVPADALLGLTADVLRQLVATRAREGERLAELMMERLASLRALARQAAPLVPALIEQQRLRFLERWDAALAATDQQADPAAARDRALAEATAFALRIDVAEELGRLTVHLDEIEAVLKKGGEVGKRLDFLIQELHREANTLGSKSATLEMTQIAVGMKVLIEQMREQVQNLE